MKKDPNIKIFVTHFNKPEFIYEDDVFVPIQAWKKNSKIDLGIQWDDTWDNISEKNSQYAELTTQYWVRKNYDLSNVDYVWFCHYRRYMTYMHKPNVLEYIWKKNPYSKWERTLLPWYYKAVNEWCYCKWFNVDILKGISKSTKDYLKNNEFDLYQCKRETAYLSKLLTKLWIRNSYLRYEPPVLNYDNLKIYKMAMELFFNTHPECIKSIISIQNEWRGWLVLAHRHMYIMKKSLFLNYSKRLFEYLFLLEELINKNQYDFYHYFNDNRFYWIISEPLINYRRCFMTDDYSIKSSFDANMYFCV